MTRIAVTGAAGPVGRRLTRRLAADDAVTEVVAIDRARVERGAKISFRRASLTVDDLDESLADVDVVCHLAGSDPLEDVEADHDLRATQRVLEAAARAGVRHVIVRSSATVYGAWEDNPIPLSETAPRRPNAENDWASMRARIEDAVDAFAAANPAVVVAVLRPVVTVSDRGPDELGRVLAAARSVTAPDADVPVQFVHADDVAEAAIVVWRSRAGGIYNVAPEGAIEQSMVRALVGGAPRLALSETSARRITSFGWRTQLAPTPPGFVPFVLHPWVVASDRLRSLGWTPGHDNAEAFVAGHAAAPWAQLSPQRRQELALGLAGSVLVGTGAAAVWALRRSVGRRR